LSPYLPLQGARAELEEQKPDMSISSVERREQREQKNEVDE
jgi:hypothetical protein